MPNAVIDSLIDNEKSYAYARIERSSCPAYAHMNLDIRLGRTGYGPGGKIVVTCQIGGDGDYSPHFEKTYAWKFGFKQGGYDPLQLADLEQGVKAMRKVEKGFQKQVDEEGYPKSFADYCMYVMQAMGNLPMIAEPGDGWPTGGLMTDKGIFTNPIQQARKLQHMEAALLSVFQRKAA